MDPFTYNGLPARVIFGFGTRSKLKAEVQALKVKRALVLSTSEQAKSSEEAVALLGELCAGTFHGAAMHTPLAVTEAALGVVKACAADGLVAIGGGSTTGLGKAIALRTDLPQIVLPTTYAGSEMTPILGETQDGKKTTIRSPKVLPETVIYDVELTMTLPPALSGTSGMNAIAHAVEAMYAEDKNPVVSFMAEESIAQLGRSLPKIASEPLDRSHREGALYGAWLAGMCLGSVGMALHHKLCHALGGSFDLPHAETHTVLLPHVLAYNAPAAPDAIARAARALGDPDPALALYRLAGAIGAKRSLKELGLPESGIDKAVDLAVANPYFNPRPIERTVIRELLVRAFAGEPPVAG